MVVRRSVRKSPRYATALGLGPSTPMEIAMVFDRKAPSAVAKLKRSIFGPRAQDLWLEVQAYVTQNGQDVQRSIARRVEERAQDLRSEVRAYVDQQVHLLVSGLRANSRS